MTNIDDDNLETEAIFKCVKALKPLSDEAKIRIFKHLLERFGLNSQQSNTPITKQEDNYKPNAQNDGNSLQNLLLGETTKQVVADIATPIVDNFSSVKDVLIRNLHSSEPELLLVVAFYASGGSTEIFPREKLVEIYKENNCFNNQRSKGLSAYIQGLIKQALIKTVSDNQFTLLPQGLEKAKDILNGKSVSKPRKTNTKKKSKPKETNND